MDRLTVDYGKKFSPFRYVMKDGSDAEIGYFKNYDAFYSHMLMVQKLAEYEDLEEQGLLLRLPCKVGTSVYMVGQDCGGDTLDCMRGDCEGCPYLYSFVEENKFETYMLEDIDKTIFLTQAEAEQKLKEMECD